MDLIKLLNENYLIFLPALWIIGYALKQTPFIPDWSIIWILLAISLGIAFLAFGFNFESVVNGITAAGVAVFGHQLVKQTKNATSENKT